MSTSVASSINLSSLGLGTGLNTSSLVSQLVAIEGAPLTVLQTKSTNISSASSTLATFSTNLNALQTAAKALADPTQYNAYTASSSSPQVVATTTSGASAGTHSVTISQVAQAQTTYSNPQASGTTALGISGTLGLTVGGSTVNVAVSATESLTDIATAISSSGAPVTASVVFDGSQYRLDVQGSQTGAANAISFSEAGFSLGLTTPANTYQAAQDTKATVDGIAVTSSTNQITSAIPGVTLAATGTTSGASTVTVSANSSSLATQLQAFVTAYNNVVTSGHSDIGFGTTTASNALLAGDSGIRTALDQISSLVTRPVAGADATLNSLGSLGVALNSDGTLSLNTTTLAQAVASDPTGVEKLLVTSSSQGMTGVMGTLSTTIDGLANNASAVLKTESQLFANQTTEVTKQIAAMQTRLQAYQTLLQTEFTTADTLVNTQRTLFSAVGGTGTFM